MDLATRIGANPAKAVSRSNISFLGKGPTKNPLFQNRLAGLENATEANLGKPETLFAAINDAVGWMKDGKLNSIQSEILGHNLTGIEKIINPPVLPMASVTPIRSGIKTVAPKPRSDIERLLSGEPYTDARGRRWDLTPPEKGFQISSRRPGPGDQGSYYTARTEPRWKQQGFKSRKEWEQAEVKAQYEELIKNQGKLDYEVESFLKQLDEKILKAQEGFLTRADLNTMSPEVLDNLRRTVDPIGMHRMFGEITKFASGGLARILDI